MASIRATEGRRGAQQAAPSGMRTAAARRLAGSGRSIRSVEGRAGAREAAPISVARATSSPSIRSVEGQSGAREASGPKPLGSSPSIRSVEGRKGSAEASPSYVPKPPTFRPNVKIAPTSSGGSSTYKAPTASSAPAPSTTSSTSTRKYETGGTLDVPSTTSGGTAGTVKNEGPSSANYGGKGRGSGREGSRINRQNPRRSRSTTMDELKKRAAKQLGI